MLRRPQTAESSDRETPITGCDRRDSDGQDDYRIRLAPIARVEPDTLDCAHRRSRAVAVLVFYERQQADAGSVESARLVEILRDAG